MQDAAGAILVDDKKSISDIPKQTDSINKKSEAAWTWALALVNASGGSPSSDVLALAEREKRGEISTDDMIKYVTKKYQGKERG